MSEETAAPATAPTPDVAAQPEPVETAAQPADAEAPAETAAPAEPNADALALQKVQEEKAEEAKRLDALRRRARSVGKARERDRQKDAQLDELRAQLDRMRPAAELAELAAKDPVAAAKRMAGDKLLDVYRALTPDVLGVQQEAEDVSKLPASVRAKLEEMDAMKARLAKLDELEKSVEQMAKAREEAQAALAKQARADAAQEVFNAGLKSVTPETFPLVATHPEGAALVQAEWEAMVRAEAAAGRLRKPSDAVALVKRAAEKVQQKKQAEADWLLTSAYVKDRLPVQTQAPQGTSTPAQPQASAPSKAPADTRKRLASLQAEEQAKTAESQQPTQQPTAPAPSKAKPRSVVPGPLGTAPAGAPDMRKIPFDQRVKLLAQQMAKR